MVSAVEFGGGAPPRGFGRITLEIRQAVSPWQQGLILAGGLVAGLLVAMIILMIAGVGPAALYEEFVLSIVSSTQSTT